MKHRTTATVAAILALITLNVMAGDIVGGGTIEFRGKLSADTCYVESSSGDAKTIMVDMGEINMMQLGTLANPQMSQNAAGATFHIVCSSPTNIDLMFAASPAHLEGGNKILKVNNGATGSGLASGLGIAVYPSRASATESSAYDLSNGVLFGGTMVPGQKVRVQFVAAYVLESGYMAMGTANATLPFTIVTW